MADLPRVVVVTDPLCSWCWGIAASVEEARAALDGAVRFDLLFGGINLDSTLPVGAYGRHRLSRLWAEVAMVTGQPFALAPSTQPFVYNSRALCAVLEAVRAIDVKPPFDFLSDLQRGFFSAADNVCAHDGLVARLSALGYDSGRVMSLAASDAIVGRTHNGFAEARRYGTHAMPSILLEESGHRRLLAGGYLDTATLVTTIERAIKRN